MVILIGGVSCSGKTLMAQTLLERYHIPYLSIDHLKMGLIRSGNTDFSAEEEDSVLEPKLWPIVKGIVMTCVENKQNLVVEGCYLPPEEVSVFGEEYLTQIVSLYLVFSQQYIRDHWEHGILAHSSVIEKRGPLETQGYLSVQNLCRMHRQLKERCLKSGARFFEIEQDYERGMQKAYDWVDERCGVLFPGGYRRPATRESCR